MTDMDLTHGQLSRREFLRIGGLTLVTIGALLAGCRPSTSDETASGSSLAIDREAAPTATPPTEANAGTGDQVAPAATPTATRTAVPAAPATTQPTDGTAKAATPTATPATEAVYVACPRGLVNDPYPGHCKLYRDTNGNGYCDWSVPGSGKVPAGQMSVLGGERPRR